MTLDKLINNVKSAYKGVKDEDTFLRIANEIEAEIASKTYEEFVYFGKVTPKRMIVNTPYDDLYLNGMLAKLYLIDCEVEKYTIYQSKYVERLQEYLRMLNRTQRMLTKEWGNRR